MPAHDTADARTALMATYFARYPHPQAGMRCPPLRSSSPPLRQYDSNVSNRRLQRSQQKPSTEGFAARGRTIYNANWTLDPATSSETKVQAGQPWPQQYSALVELQRIDAEEERRRTVGYEFLMAARRDFDVESIQMPVQEGQTSAWDDERRAAEMFELYIRMED